MLPSLWLSPKQSILAKATGVDRYQVIHEALVAALCLAGYAVELSASTSSQTADSRCFAAPVQWDVIETASREKIAGGAQRRSRGAVLHQGSVRVPGGLRSPEADWVDDFLAPLGDRVEEISKEAITEIANKADVESRKKFQPIESGD